MTYKYKWKKKDFHVYSESEVPKRVTDKITKWLTDHDISSKGANMVLIPGGHKSIHILRIYYKK